MVPDLTNHSNNVKEPSGDPCPQRKFRSLVSLHFPEQSRWRLGGDTDGYSCEHLLFFINQTTVVQNGKELLAVSCDICNNIKLVDVETKKALVVFQCADPPWHICSGPDGGLLIACRSVNIQQLDSSFRVTNTFRLNADRMCYLPAQHNTLVVNSLFEFKAVSLLDGHQVWNMKCDGLRPDCLLFCPQQDVLLISDSFKPQVCVMNPSNGSMIQTIEIPNILGTLTMCLCNNQIVMLQWAQKSTYRRLLSSCSLKQIV